MIKALVFRALQILLSLAAAAVVKPDFIPAGVVGTHPVIGVLVRIGAFCVVFFIVQLFSPSKSTA